ncbi:MAG: hypothetical protein IJL06_04330, partial [Kiritimatiellae bacterium]|nr:hypothetical protein [Kiritimatiellia bacterium]
MKRISALLASAALAPAAFAESAVTPRYYVGDSLVALYDAVCNATNAAGAWIHDGAATTWLDLSGNGRDWTLTANGSWTDTTFEFNGLSATLSPGLPYYYTQEVRLEMDSGRWSLFGSGQNNQIYQGLVTINNQYIRLQQFEVAWNGDRNKQMKYLDASGVSSAPFTTAVTYDKPGKGSLACYADGAATPSASKSNSWESDGRSAIGDRSIGGYAGKGRIQSIRLYSRVLTDAEIARNHLVDQVRFEGAALPEPLEPAVSCTQVAGAGDAGCAVVRLSASSVGWLASALVSATVECSATPDFASPSSFPAAIEAGGASGVAVLTGLEPGATVYV